MALSGGLHMKPTHDNTKANISSLVPSTLYLGGCGGSFRTTDWRDENLRAQERHAALRTSWPYLPNML